jgi:arylsulfatase
LLAGTTLAAASALGASSQAQQRPTAQAQPATPAAGRRPNILVIFGDDIGYWNISAYNRGMMGYRTPNIDRIAKEGAIFTDLYAQQSAGSCCSWSSAPSVSMCGRTRSCRFACLN